MNPYRTKIDQLLHFVEANLDKKHQLTELAARVHLSKYHFHRMITAYLQEPLGTYINRLRMETGAKLLRYSKQSINSIAYEVGYDTPAAFTKSFKKVFQTSPSVYRKNKEWRLTIPKIQVEQPVFKLSKSIKYVGAKRLLYHQSKGGYQLEKLDLVWQKILQLAHQHRLLTSNTTYYGISRDDPSITATHQLRYDACMSIEKNQTFPITIFNELQIIGGKYLSIVYRGSYDQIGLVYQQIFRELITKEYYQLRSAFIFEQYLNESRDTLPSNLLTEIFIPIE